MNLWKFLWRGYKCPSRLVHFNFFHYSWQQIPNSTSFQPQGHFPAPKTYHFACLTLLLLSILLKIFIKCPSVSIIIHIQIFSAIIRLDSSKSICMTVKQTAFSSRIPTLRLAYIGVMLSWQNVWPFTRIQIASQWAQERRNSRLQKSGFLSQTGASQDSIMNGFLSTRKEEYCRRLIQLRLCQV